MASKRGGLRVVCLRWTKVSLRETSGMGRRLRRASGLGEMRTQGALRDPQTPGNGVLRFPGRQALLHLGEVKLFGFGWHAPGSFRLKVHLRYPYRGPLGDISGPWVDVRRPSARYHGGPVPAEPGSGPRQLW